MAGGGAANSGVGNGLGIKRTTVLSWRARLFADGLESVGEVHNGRGRKAKITGDEVRASGACHAAGDPPDAPQWSCRSMAKTAGVSRATVQDIWEAHGL